MICKLKQIKEEVSKYDQIVPLLSEYLSSSCKVFKAGQVAKHLAAWQNITKDKEILAYVQGVEIDLT